MSRKLLSMREFMRRERRTNQGMADACNCSVDTIKRWKTDMAQVDYNERTKEFTVTLRNVTRKGRFSDD